MPRGVKGSEKAKEPTAKRPYHRKTKPVVEAAPVAASARKPYPSIAERIAAAEK